MPSRRMKHEEYILQFVIQAKKAIDTYSQLLRATNHIIILVRTSNIAYLNLEWGNFIATHESLL